jgi:hypothetical protein
LKFNFLGGQHKGFSPNQNTQETVNMFLEVDPSEDNKLTLYRVDGKVAFLTLPTQPIYAMSEFRGVLYVVAGTTLYKVLADFSYTTIGTVDLEFDTTIAANNGGQVCFNSGITNKAYVYNTSTSTLTQITDPDFFGSPRVDYLDGYGVFIRPNSQQFYVSAYNDFLTFDGLDFSSSGSDPDNLVTGIVDHRELVLFGRKTTSFWFSVGGEGAGVPGVGGAIQVGRRGAERGGSHASSGREELRGLLDLRDEVRVAERAGGFEGAVVDAKHVHAAHVPTSAARGASRSLPVAWGMCWKLSIGTTATLSSAARNWAART